MVGELLDRSSARSSAQSAVETRGEIVGTSLMAALNMMGLSIAP